MRNSALIRAGVAATLVSGAGFALLGTPAQADQGFHLIGVPQANPRDGIQNDVVTPSAKQSSVAWGNLPLTNPDTANGVTHYGYNTSNGGALTQSATEAFKTEPDKNVYLVFRGRHYLYQGHEGGPRGYVTRVNLDETDPAKRVTLISDVDEQGHAFPTLDGITWDPFTHQLLLTDESSAPDGAVLAVDLDVKGDAVTGRAKRLDAIGSGGYEGVQNDDRGNVWLVEDIGGAAAGGGKVPNSYVYRFVPTDKTDLAKGGTLQALQIERVGGGPATAAQLQANPKDRFITKLHHYGSSFRTRWVTVHSGTTGSFDATAAAAAAKATPLKRPENGAFRPGTDFRKFYFTETGDTTDTSTLPGAYGGVFRLSMSSPSARTGRISIAVVGNERHTGLDNLSFLTSRDLLVVEDAGDSLHAARNGLDSGYRYTVAGGHSRHTSPRATRWLAEGRDASATFDALGGPDYNDGDNEITGIHVSDGDPTTAGILGAKRPHPDSDRWRTFWTQQHGDNVTWDVTWHASH